MRERSEQRLIERILKSPHRWDPEIHLYEDLRRSFDSLDDVGRRSATIRALRYWKRIPTKKQEESVCLLSGLWRYHFLANDLERTIAMADLIFKMGKRTSRPALEAEGLLGKGMVSLAKGDVSRAIQTLELSRALFVTCGSNKQDSIRVCLRLADAYRRSGDRSSAMAILQRARLDCLETEDIPSLGSASQGLGILSLEAGDMLAAAKHFKFVRESSGLLGSKRRALRALLGLAITHLRSGDLKEAEKETKAALIEASLAQLPREIAIAQEYLGEIDARRGKWLSALRYYAQAMRFANSAFGADSKVELHLRLAELWVGKGNLRYARLHVNRGLTRAVDAEDHMALSRLKVEVDWRSGADGEGSVRKLLRLADDLQEQGLGYELLLTACSIFRIATESGLMEVASEWRSKASSLAILGGTDSLLTQWMSEGQREESEVIETKKSVSKLWDEIPKVDLEQYGIITRSQAIIEQGSLLAKVAPTRIPILLTGESGTGKELFASLTHKLSPNSSGPYLAINCAAMPADLIESELFGHRRGAFTGATVDKDGLFRSAHRGTMFLDEIGEMSLSAQSKLLRVLETGEIRRVGDTESHMVDVRIVAATNLNLMKEVQRGTFRRDLYFRLRGLEVHLPPLRHRLVDIPLLAEHFVQSMCDDLGKGISLPFETRQWLIGQEWPGNVRELKLAIERACAIAPQEGSLYPYHFIHADVGSKVQSLPSELREIEKARVTNALEATGWNVTSAAELLGLTRTTLSSRLKRLGIKRPKE